MTQRKNSSGRWSKLAGRRNGRNLGQELLHVEVGFYEGVVQMGEGVRTIGLDRLFYDMVKQLLDECIVGLLAANRELRHIMGSGQANFFAVIGQILAHRINRLFVLGCPETAHGIILLEAESQRVDAGMAALARLRAGQLGNFLAHREVGGEVRVFEGHHGHRRRLQER